METNVKNVNRDIIGVIIVGIVIVTGIYIFTSLADIGGTTEYFSASENSTMNTSSVLISPIEDGVSSFSAQVYNQTWLNFDGVDDYVNLSDYKYYFNRTNNYSFILRYKTFSNYTLSYSNIFTNTLTGNSRVALSLLNQTLLYADYNGSVYIGQQKISMQPHNQWNFVFVRNRAGNINETFINMSLNGVFSSGGMSAPATSSVQQFYIGSKGGSDSYFNGSIDYFYIFNYTMLETDSENIRQTNSLYSNYSYVLSETPQYMSKIYLVNDSLIYGNYGRFLYRSIDGGKTWDLHNMTQGTGSNTLFVSKNGTTIITSGGNGNISISIGNWTNWNNKTIFQCQNESGEGFGILLTNSISEDSYGNIYIGEYSDTSGTSNGNCSYIYKSNNAGNTWTIVYNHTKEGYSGRHIHFLEVDPYTNYIYAAQGDSEYGGSRLIRSIDNGTTWTTIENISGTSQYMDVAFTPTCRFFGTDITGGDNMIRKTCNDTTLETVYTMAPDEDGYGWNLKTDYENDRILVATQSSGGSGYSMLLTGLDNGEKWVGSNYLNNLPNYNGYSWISNFNSTGYFYLVNSNISKSYIAYFNSSPKKYNYFVELKLNENSGTTAYDSSGNGNNGTISGATWQNDGVLVSLSSSDVNVNSQSGLLTLLNSEYLYSYIVKYWTYFKESTNPGTTASLVMVDSLGNSTTFLSILIVISFAVVILTLFKPSVNTNPLGKPHY